MGIALLDSVDNEVEMKLLLFTWMVQCGIDKSKDPDVLSYSLVTLHNSLVLVDLSTPGLPSLRNMHQPL